MLNHPRQRRNHGRRHGKRQDIDPATSILGPSDGGSLGPTIPTVPLSSPALPLPTISIPTIPIIPDPTLVSHSSSTTNHSTASFQSRTSSDTSASTSSSPSSSSSSTTTSSTMLSTSSSTPSNLLSGPTSTSNPLSSFTSIITTTSGAIPITITRIILPSASLSSEPQPNLSFLHNKAESGAVFAIVALVALAAFGFLGFRFYKTIKERNADRETEDAARDAAKVSVRLDDDDQGEGYLEGHSSSGHSMAQFANGPPVIRGDFHTGGTLGIGDFDIHPVVNGSGSSDHGVHHAALQIQPLFQQGSPRTSQDTSDRTDITDAERSSLSLHSNKSGENLLSNTRPTLQLRARSNTMGSSNHATLTTPSVAHSYQPPPFTLPLPEAFGEGERGRPSSVPEALDDNEDYYRSSAGRVLKIANE
ncbi:hypothetical protein K439DRAFT_410056 [Ramaria rubella]|nr:hypothetical protein K439DRAFT_410056 [Ramaria rubella]